MWRLVALVNLNNFHAQQPKCMTYIANGPFCDACALTALSFLFRGTKHAASLHVLSAISRGRQDYRYFLYNIIKCHKCNKCL